MVAATQLMEKESVAAKGEAMAGYKYSEVGLIPKDWSAVPLAAVSRSISDGTHFTPRYVSRGIPFYSVENVTARNFTDTKFITEREHIELVKRCRPERGDILMTRITAGVLGDTVLIDWDVHASIYVSLALIKPNDLICPEFLFRYSQSRAFVLDVEKRGLRNATPKKINMIDIGTVPVPLPPTKVEQKAIAAALADADALVESLEKLLAKKRDIKQGAMQELLTGKRRLPGFGGGWEMRGLADLAEIRSGGTPSTTQSQFWDGDILWCTPTDITELQGRKYLEATSRTISALGLKSSSAELIPAKSVVMTSRATIGECAINLVPVTTNQGFKNFIPSKDVDVEFLYYLLITQQQGFISVCGGSTFLEIGKTQLAAFQVNVPTTKTEQIAIASVLSDMDAEIATLEAKLAKARLLKQGMMQELLTGRIRLV